jgi:ubiquinone/menaquinone biosynthesis C-methylase UbiE
MADRLEFDEEASRAVEAVYTTDDVVEQRRLTLEALNLQPGQRVLDIGSGPGFLACEIAEAVGPGGSVHGIDMSPSMLAIARGRTPGDGAAPVEFTEGSATDLSFPDAGFDLVVSTQVYEYVDDMPAALAEARRVLDDGGRLAIIDTDWDSIVWRSADDERMARVLRAWDEHLAHRDLPRRLPELLAKAGFELEGCRVIPMLNVGYTRASYSAGVLEMIAGFVVGRQGVTAEEASEWAEDLKGLGPEYFFSLNRYLFVGRKTR